jgi:hypothetical protein
VIDCRNPANVHTLKRLRSRYGFEPKLKKLRELILLGRAKRRLSIVSGRLLWEVPYTSPIAISVVTDAAITIFFTALPPVKDEQRATAKRKREYFRGIEDDDDGYEERI